MAKSKSAIKIPSSNTGIGSIEKNVKVGDAVKMTEYMKVPSVEHWLSCFPDTEKGHKKALKLLDKYPKTCGFCYWNQPSKATGNRSCQSPPLIEGKTFVYIDKAAGSAVCHLFRIAPDADSRGGGANAWI